MNIDFVLFIATLLCTVFISWVSIDNLWVKKKRYLTSKGWYIIVSLVVFFVLSLFQYKRNEDNKDIIQNYYMSAPDPIIRLYDKAAIVKDKSNKNLYHINICSLNAGSTGFDMHISLFAQDTAGYKYFLMAFNTKNDIKLNKDDAWTFDVTLPDKIYYKSIYVLLIGSYKDLKKENTYVVEECYYHSIKDNTTKSFTGDYSNWVFTQFLKYDTTANSYFQKVKKIKEMSPTM